MEAVLGIFLILHGLVHFLYAGHSIRLFTLQPGMIWPDASWAFSKNMRTRRLRTFCGMLCLLAGVVFIISGVGCLFDSTWWGSWAIAAAIFSVTVYLLMWNGRVQKLHDQGGIGILINILVMIIALYVL